MVFFLGNLGSHSIPTTAYSGDNVNQVLQSNAEEFINSLRGVQRWNDNVKVSKLYMDTQLFYFQGGNSKLVAHLNDYIDDALHPKISFSDDLIVSKYQRQIADLVGGNR